MTITEIVKKLVGEIEPIGETNIDNKRYDNLMLMCAIVDDLVCAIENVADKNKDRAEFSMKRAGHYAYNFINKTLGIKE